MCEEGGVVLGWGLEGGREGRRAGSHAGVCTTNQTNTASLGSLWRRRDLGCAQSLNALELIPGLLLQCCLLLCILRTQQRESGNMRSTKQNIQP